MTNEQALNHLFSLALEASVPAKVHKMSQEAFEALKKAIEPNVKCEAPKLVEKA